MVREDISKQAFEAYEKVKASGKTNMCDVKTVGILSCLQREVVLDIMENYAWLEEKYIDYLVAKGEKEYL